LLHHVPLKLPDRHFHVMHHAERHLSRVAEELLQMISAP
jgi:hypothetical protein